MLIRFLFTVVQFTGRGMFVGNAGEALDVADDLALTMIAEGKAEAVEAAAPDDGTVDFFTAPVLDADGEPLDPPAGDIAADIAAPAAIPAAPKPKRGKAAASPLDAPVA